MTPEQRKAAAQQLKKNPLLVEVFDKCDVDMYAAWRSESNLETRNELWFESRAIKTFRRKLNAAIRDAAGDSDDNTGN